MRTAGKEKSCADIKKMIMIKLPTLIKWLKANQNKWDSRRVELYALGKEEDWLKEKRKKDLSLPPRKNYKWTKQEDLIAVHMRKVGYSCRKIGERLGRSEDSVRNRLARLEMRETGAKEAMV